MSMLNISQRHFPSLLSSPSAHSRLSTSTTPIERSRHNSPNAPARWCEKWPIQPETQVLSPTCHFNYMCPEHTPMILPKRRLPNLMRHSGDSHLSNNSKHAAATNRSMFGRIWKQNADNVSCRAVIRKLGKTQNLLQQRFLAEGKKIETQKWYTRWKTEIISNKSLTEWRLGRSKWVTHQTKLRLKEEIG